MAKSTVQCPHCQEPVTLPIGQVGRCPACRGEVRIHEVGAGVEDEALKRLLSKVKIVERVGGSSGTPPESPPPKKRPWWKFWG
jgi:primosomal protein N'